MENQQSPAQSQSLAPQPTVQPTIGVSSEPKIPKLVKPLLLVLFVFILLGSLLFLAWKFLPSTGWLGKLRFWEKPEEKEAEMFVGAPVSSPEATPVSTPSASQAASPSAQASPQTSSPSASLIPSPSATSSALPSGGNSIELKVKFASVPANHSDINLPEQNRQKEVKVVFDSLDSEESVEEQAVFTYISYISSPDYQKYTASIPLAELDLEGGSYNILIKGPAHLQARFCKEEQTEDDTCTDDDYFTIDISASDSYSFDFSSRDLKFGDANNDNEVNVQDYSVVQDCIISNVWLGSQEYEDGCSLTDGNFDGVCGPVDGDLLMATLGSQAGEE